MLSMGSCGVARLQMKVGHMDGMHCFIDSTYILVKIKSVSLYNCRTVYKLRSLGFYCVVFYERNRKIGYIAWVWPLLNYMCLHCYSQIENQPFLVMLRFQESLSYDGICSQFCGMCKHSRYNILVFTKYFHEAKCFGNGSLSGRCTCLPSIHLSHVPIAACRHNMTPLYFITMDGCDFMHFSFWLLPVYQKKIQILFLQQWGNFCMQRYWK